MKILILTVIVCGTTFSIGVAQNRFDALRFGQLYPAMDPSTMAIGGSSGSSFTGFGSFIHNPASSALSDKSFFYFGLGNRDVSEKATYINTSTKFTDNETGVSNFGFLYKFPTNQGSLVLGGGYAQTSDFNRAFSVNAFNPGSSITDYLVDAPNQYFNPAYDSYAVDCNDEALTQCFSVLRADGQYFGMDQYVEMTERGQLGEYSMFLSTEFQKNLFLGISVGLPAGSYSYRRTFIEEDILNNYAGASYDVDAIIVEDKIDASIRGINARIGIIFKPVDFISLGASYTTRTRMEIDERYSTKIQTDFKTFDTDGFNSYVSDPFRGEINYTVFQPARIHAGVSVDAGFAGITATIERINYSRMEMEGLGALNDRNENRTMRNDFKDVVNLRFGAHLNLGNITPRVGYGINPGAVKGIDMEKQFISAGLSFRLSDDIKLDLGAQYATWKDNILLYDYYNQSGALVPEVTSQRIGRFQGMIGIAVGF